MLPGRYDGLFLASALVAVGLSIVLWLTHFSKVQPTVGLVGIAAAASLVVILGMFDLWLMLADASWFTRITVAVVLNAIVPVSAGLTAMCIPEFNRHDSMETPAHFIYAGGLQRLVIILLLLVVSVPVRACSGWRIGSQNRDGSLQLANSRLNIASVMAITALVAIAFAGWQWAHRNFDAGHGLFDMDGVSGRVLAVCGFELVLFLCFWFISFYIAMFWRRGRKNYSWLVPLIGLLFVGCLFVIGVWFLGIDTSVFRMAAQHSFAIAVYATLAFVGIRLANLWGFRFLHLRRPELWSSSDSKPKRFGWSGVVLGILFLSSPVVVAGLFDVRVLILHSADTAMRTRRFTKKIGVQPVADVNSVQWPGDGQASVSVETQSQQQFVLGGSDDTTQLVQAFAENGALEYVQISSADKIYARSLKPLHSLKRIGGVWITGPDLEPVALKQLLTGGPKINSVRLFLNEITPEHIHAFASQPPMTLMLVPRASSSPIELDNETLSILGRHRMTALRVRSESPDVNLSVLGLRMMSIQDSHVTQSVVKQLASIQQLETLTLDRCNIDKDAFGFLGRLPAELAIRDCEPPISSASLHILAMQDRSEKMVVVQSDIDSYQQACLHRTARMSNIRFKRTEDEVYATLGQMQPYPFAEALARNDDDPVQTLTAIAHEARLGADGQIVGLDIAGMPMDAELARSIRSLPHLKHLAISDPPGVGGFIGFGEPEDGITCRTLLDISQLESLEIPEDRLFNDDWLHKISKLKNLERLMLPFPGVPYQDALPYEESTVVAFGEDFARNLEELIQDWTTVPSNYGVGISLDAYENVTPQGIGTLARLERMKSVVVPGPLMGNDFMTVIESWPALMELHAPFSVLDQKLLTRLGKLKQLQNLSFGVEAGNLEEAYAVIESLPQLKAVQLFIMDRRHLVEDRQAGVKRIRKIHPNGTFGVIVYGHDS